MKVLNFGSMNIDNVYYLDHFVQPGETKDVKRLDVNPGGKGLNQSIAMSRAGVKVHHAGLFGNGGDTLKKYLRDNNVDVEFVNKSDAMQGHAIIQVDSEGENCIIVHGGSNTSINIDYIDEVFAAFDKDTILVLQNEISELGYIIEKAHQKGMTVVLNPSPLSIELINLDYTMISWVILNQLEGIALSSAEKVEDIIDYFLKSYPKLNVVLTLGKEGSVCIHNGQVIQQSAMNTEVVDTTGAGDTFTGYFIAGMSAGKDIEVALQEATIAASICVSRKGGAPSIPVYEEVEKNL